MSDYPATLGDLAELDQALRAQITQLDNRLARTEKQVASDAEVTDEKMAGLREKVYAAEAWIELASGAITRLEGRIGELEKLWAVALENPELVRELAAQALKGRAAP